MMMSETGTKAVVSTSHNRTIDEVSQRTATVPVILSGASYRLAMARFTHQHCYGTK